MLKKVILTKKCLNIQFLFFLTNFILKTQQNVVDLHKIIKNK
jgi:hypothetical protein